jgi:hypothetical protein
MRQERCEARHFEKFPVILAVLSEFRCSEFRCSEFRCHAGIVAACPAATTRRERRCGRDRAGWFEGLSWPGSSRPPRPFAQRFQDRSRRDKPGDDAFCFNGRSRFAVLLPRVTDRPLHQALHQRNLELVIGHRPRAVGRGLAREVRRVLVLRAAFHHVLDDLEVARRA